jgi:hypothetical protein
MAGHGWRYTVNVPLWILGKDTEGESVAVSSSWYLLRPFVSSSICYFAAFQGTPGPVKLPCHPQQQHALLHNCWWLEATANEAPAALISVLHISGATCFCSPRLFT